MIVFCFIGAIISGILWYRHYKYEELVLFKEKFKDVRAELILQTIICGLVSWFGILLYLFFVFTGTDFENHKYK